MRIPLRVLFLLERQIRLKNPHRKIYADVYADIAKKVSSKPESDEFEEFDAQYMLDNLFESVFWRWHEGLQGTEGEANRWYKAWEHRSDFERGSDLCYLEIQAGGLRDGISHYLKHPEFRTDWLDWYCADVLTYCEYLETIKLNQPIVGLLSTVWLWQGGWSAVRGFAAKFLFKTVKWAIWAALAVLIFAFLGKWFLLAFVAVTGLRIFFKFRRRRTINALIEAARTTYHTFDTETFSWEVALAHMQRVREHSTEDWTGELYRLVESRRTMQLKADTA